LFCCSRTTLNHELQDCLTSNYYWSVLAFRPKTQTDQDILCTCT
jgi:hypothetical protein